MKTYTQTSKIAEMLRDATHASPRPWGLAEKIFDQIAAAVFALLGYEEREDEKRRRILPMSIGSRVVLPNTSVQVTARSQDTFRPEHIVIGGNPAYWIINDIKIGNRSQFIQGGDIPGEAFAFNAVGSRVSFETVHAAMDFAMLVTYAGPNREGEPFACGVIGTVTP